MADDKDTRPTADGVAAPGGSAAAKEGAVSSSAAGAATAAAAARPMDLPALTSANGESHESRISFLADVNLHVKVELGRTRMYVEDVLRLNPGSVVELDKPAGDPVDVFVNERHVARGEVLVVNDNFCVRISEIIQEVAPEC